jgi:hypothetical protein
MHPDPLMCVGVGEEGGGGGRHFTLHVPTPFQLDQARPASGGHSFRLTRTACVHLDQRGLQQQWPRRQNGRCGTGRSSCGNSLDYLQCRDSWLHHIRHSPLRNIVRLVLSTCTGERDGQTRSIVATGCSPFSMNVRNCVTRCRV